MHSLVRFAAGLGGALARWGLPSPAIPCCSTLILNQTQVGLPRRGAARPLAVGVEAAATASSEQIKQQLAEQLKGLDRGIFGVAMAKKTAVHDLLKQLELQSPVADPVDNMHMLEGDWTLLYSTITITGVKRSKLGLREFIKLGDFVQSIRPAEALAVNTVAFSVTGLGLIKGSLTINAGYRRASPSRVDIDFHEASLAPKELQKLFEANYDLLLSIFNPQGHLDVTYVDSSHRIGRDDKGNVFYLQRV